jgi:hypothetical protein
MKKQYIFAVVFFVCTMANAQKQGNIWYFADSCGLDFTSGSPVVLTDGSIGDGVHWGTEGTAAICDSAGHLLFFANAEKAWDRTHHIMPNGNGLMGGESSTQGALIIPMPGTDHLFYLFTTDHFQNNLANGLRYSIVNMCLNGGRGDIEPLQKNILLLDSAGEKMAATNHANGTDIWLVNHQYFTDAFYAYRISANGIIDTVISHVGAVHINSANPEDTGPAIGQMKISPDGSKIAIAMGNLTPTVLELFDFDNSTGVVSNLNSLTSENSVYGVSFSPDNSKLYFTTNGSHQLIQYDLSAGNAAAIAASRDLIFNASTWPLAGMQLGPDGKIYIAGNYDYLDVIESPNIAGGSCNYSHDAIYLGHIAWYGITNFIDSYNYKNGIPNCNALSVNEAETGTVISVYPNPFSSEAALHTGRPLRNATLTLSNCLGQSVKEIKNISGETIIMQLGSLVSGLYFFRLAEVNEMPVTGKLIITD